MAEQYFTSHPSTGHDEKEITFRFQDQWLKLMTDRGVFSKNRVDYGSRVLITEMSRQDLIEGNILDVGCGYGPLGLVAAKLWPRKKVDLTDVNERALNLARHNAVQNKLMNVHVFQSDGYSKITQKYGLIVTNPPIRAGKEVVSRILREAKTYLNPDGMILTVIQKKQGEPSARRLLTETFGNCTILSRDKGYYVLKSVAQYAD